MLEFRKPNELDINEIESFKQEFQEANSGMDGTGTLNECDVKEWLLTNKVMETTTNSMYYRFLQYGLFDSTNNSLLGLIQIRLELKGYLIEFGGHIGYCVRPSAKKRLC